jgi:hypothetical protein
MSMLKKKKTNTRRDRNRAKAAAFVAAADEDSGIFKVSFPRDIGGIDIIVEAAGDRTLVHCANEEEAVDLFAALIRRNPVDQWYIDRLRQYRREGVLK